MTIPASGYSTAGNSTAAGVAAAGVSSVSKKYLSGVQDIFCTQDCIYYLELFFQVHYMLAESMLRIRDWVGTMTMHL